MRVRQTLIHIDDTNVDRNDALRSTLSSVFRSSETRKSLCGLVRSIGRTCTWIIMNPLLLALGETAEATYGKIQGEGFSKGVHSSY